MFSFSISTSVSPTMVHRLPVSELLCEPIKEADGDTKVQGAVGYTVMGQWPQSQRKTADLKFDLTQHHLFEDYGLTDFCRLLMDSQRLWAKENLKQHGLFSLIPHAVCKFKTVFLRFSAWTMCGLPRSYSPCGSYLNVDMR